MLVLVLSCTAVLSQNFSDRWTGFFSFVSVRDIQQGNDRIYAGTENAVFTFDLSTEELETITTINGLSGSSLTTLYYSENFDLLVIGYEDGLLEIVLDGEDVLKVVDIQNKPTIPPNRKRINHLAEYNGFLYISSDFGVSVYNLERLEFDDTYFIGEAGEQIQVRQTAVIEPYIYAATKEGGLRQALIDENNLIDFERWTRVVGGQWNAVQNLGEEVVGLRNSTIVARYDPGVGFTDLETYNVPVLDFQVHRQVLTITTAGSSFAFEPGYVPLNQVSLPFGSEDILQSGLTHNNVFYLGTEESGLFQIPFGSSNPRIILPDGPILNNPFSVDATPGQLWVNFGEVDVAFNPFPLNFRGVSNLREDVWTNLSVEEVFDANDLVSIAINPEDPNEVYMSSYQKGLLKIVDQVPTVLFNETNSPLEIPNGNTGIGLRLYGLDFDREGNLWFLQSRTNEGLQRLSPSGQFQQIDISSIIDGEAELALTEIAINRQGFVFFGTAESGLVGYDPATGRFNRIQEGVGVGNLPSVDIRALAFDNNNRLWIGTLEGLRVLFTVNDFFEEGSNPQASEIVFLEDGVAQELLFAQSITDIEVDGSNNKWISTATSGVFYVSANGQETLLRFTKENSPLPSDNVQDMTIDEFTGRVYFATTRGLVSYDGTSTAPRDNLEEVYVYPNPVRPGFVGDVTIDGLTDRANVKITDIEGNLVFETTSQGGSVLWDTTAFGRYRVASGVYMVLVTTEDNLETTVSKIMIVR
ncbi:two-component regulator propeller domain-containing protein [Aureitalea marina]|uniref:type IX secretion system anionic LPS delivery protein PorZ n=1 Tax=Aureitalea marina TaxID=930804 RepID=UPI0015E3D48D|nr:two-component regulator propeller domain-containing protein [Aureitalea marina]